MAYLLFNNNINSDVGSLAKIASTQEDINKFNLKISDYTVVEISSSDFDSVNLGQKLVNKYNGGNVTFSNSNNLQSKKTITDGINFIINTVKSFLDSNKNHPDYSKWNNYINQVKSFNIDSVTYTTEDEGLFYNNKSVEQILSDGGITVINTLQIP